MASLAKKLKAFTLYLDGVGYAGRVDELTPPKLTLKTEEYRAGDMDAPMDLDMGQEKLTLEASVGEYDSALWRQWGLSEGQQVACILRGSQGHGVNEEPVVLTCRGMVTEIDPGGWKAGDATGCKLTLSLMYYRVEINGLMDIEIDVLGAVRRVGGVDVLAARRRNLGLE
ncbi:phage major tail tube protein [Roseospira navarrensis]|nr:phage major tail tube protein [Roseospira navarrensis]